MIKNSKVYIFGDDNTIQNFDDTKDTIIRLLKGDMNNALEWSTNNQVTANQK